MKKTMQTLSTMSEDSELNELNENIQRRMNKTIQALSKMSEDSQQHINAPTTHENTFQQLNLSDYCMDEEEVSMSKVAGGGSVKSIYSGAGIKLDAFDCFHKVLNNCVCDYTFNIADAALILKLLTPDIIKKILPLVMRPATTNKKQAPAQKKQDIQSEYAEEALDYEISEINKGQNERDKDDNLKTAAMMTKRPDAPRPPDSRDVATRLSSPGSNSCSPVSAAVQALISISAPLTDNTMSQPIMSHTKLNHSNNVTEICEVMEGDTFDDGTVFRPLLKPFSLSKHEFSENVVAPIPKPAIVSTSCCKDVRSNNFSKDTSVTCATSTISSHDEINETMNTKRDVSSFSNTPTTTSVIISSMLADNMSNQVYSLPDSKLLSTRSIESPFPSTNPVLDCETFPKHNEPETLSSIPTTTLLQDDLAQCKLPQNPPQTTLAHNDPQQTTLTHGDPLMNTYDQLLSIQNMSVDLPCGLHSPFSHPLPASPMPSIMNVHLETTQVTTSIKDPLPTAPLINDNFPNTIVSQTGTHTSVANHLSHTTPMSSILSSSLPNTESEGTFIDQSFVSDDVISATVRIQNPLRTILPKPSSEHSSVGLSMVSVLSMTNAVSNSISQISPVIKIEEKKLMQYGNSIPPNRIFTKINSISNANTMTPTTLAAIPAPQQRQLFQNQMCYFSPQGMDSFIFPKGQETFKNFFTFNNNQNMAPQVVKAKTVNSRDVFPDQNELKVTTNVTKPENRGGNLEVASALLSMASENESSSDKQGGEETFQSIILDSLKDERSNVQVIFTSNGTAKIKDVEINPQEHGIKKDNFTCGKCQHVFTSVLYLTRHIKRVCPDMSQRKWKCDRCTKAFRHPFGLQQHIYTHTGERPHKCSQCSKAFYSSNDLRRHIRTHSGERPYQCSVCEKSFSTTISLKTHQYIHTGERPHKCPHCIKTFATSSKLSRHIVTHSEKRPYPCDQCAKTFNRSGDLRRHYNQHHGNVAALLECDHCNKVFATQKCLMNHKSTHNRDIEAAAPPNSLTETQHLLARTYDGARF